jgi:hypothetical protein
VSAPPHDSWPRADVVIWIPFPPQDSTAHIDDAHTVFGLHAPSNPTRSPNHCQPPDHEGRACLAAQHETCTHPMCTPGGAHVCASDCERCNRSRRPSPSLATRRSVCQCDYQTAYQSARSVGQRRTRVTDRRPRSRAPHRPTVGAMEEGRKRHCRPVERRSPPHPYDRRHSVLVGELSTRGDESSLESPR